jgi:Phage tail protein (Tail_P2_I)
VSSKLRDAKLLALATPSIGYDKQVQAACPAFDYQMYQIIDETGQVIMIPNIMGLTDSTLVDILAWQFHVDFYDRTRDLEFRKRLVQLSIIWHKTKGTPALVQEVLDLYWPGGATILEWYEYMSPLPPNYPTAPGWHDRYRFRIYVDVNIIDPADEAAVLAMIDRYKPISRWPEGIFRPSVVSNCYIGWAGVCLRFRDLTSEAPDYVIEAHGYDFFGPSLGAPATTSAPFTVQLRSGAVITDPVVVTPSDNGAGGTFTPTSVTLTTTNRVATFTYTPATEGTHQISTSNDGNLDDPPSIALVSTQQTYTLTGPASGMQGADSAPFTVQMT